VSLIAPFGRAVRVQCKKREANRNVDGAVSANRRTEIGSDWKGGVDMPFQSAVWINCVETAWGRSGVNSSIWCKSNRRGHGLTGVEFPFLTAVRVNCIDVIIGGPQIDRSIGADRGRGNKGSSSAKEPLQRSVRIDGV